MITQERLREIMHYCADTGAFTWLKKPTRVSNRVKVGTRVGTQDADGYSQVNVAEFGYRPIRLHLLAWLYMKGEFPEHELEFCNGNRADIRWGNLRESTHKLNHWKRSKSNSNSQSGLLGASPKRNGRWLSQIHANGKTINLGTFDTAQEAHDAYLEGKRGHHNRHVPVIGSD